LGRAAPGKQSVGTTEAALKPKMEKLLSKFASGDKTGMARRLCTQFLAKQSSVNYFDDKDLNSAAVAHDNIQYFCNAALGAPYPSPFGTPPRKGVTRIHQALKAASWDVTKTSLATRRW
jgi:hypothetical protein